MCEIGDRNSNFEIRRLKSYFKKNKESKSVFKPKNNIIHKVTRVPFFGFIRALKIYGPTLK